jgi:DNA ligase-1
MTFKTLLAGKAPNNLDAISYPISMSPKLDGMRAHVVDGEVVSRNLLPFKNLELQKRFGSLNFDGLDGEFMVGDPKHPEAFRKAGVLNSHDGDISDVKLWVFDDFSNPHLPFTTRFREASRRVLPSPYMKMVPHKLARNPEDVAVFEAECVAAGYEGVMLRAPDGRYKFGRSTTNEGILLKLKRFEDSEAVIDGCVELMHNANEKTLVSNGKAKRNTHQSGLVGRNRLGAVTVRDIHTGIAFSVGSGFNDEERIQLWEEHHRDKSVVGRVIKYQYFPTGSKQKPRFPTFKGFRDAVDLP